MTCTIALTEDTTCDAPAFRTWTEFGHRFASCEAHTEPEEVSVYAAMHLEVYSKESQADVFQRACAILRANGIRVKAASANDNTARAVETLLYS